MLTQNLGFPRIGEKRELKKATEAFWKGTLSKDELIAAGAEIRKINWNKQKEAGIDLIPSNDFSFYDQMLDMTCLLGNVPPRFEWEGGTIGLETLFLIARGHREADAGGLSTYASEMTKWFDTNYHYIVPEILPTTKFKLSSTKIFDEYQEAKDLGIQTKPVLIGPITYLALGKEQEAEGTDFSRFDLLDSLIPVYVEILQKLSALGAEWVQIDEPIFVVDMEPAQLEMARKAYEAICQAAPGLKIMLSAYFGELRDNRETFLNLPADAVHIDAIRGGGELDAVLAELPEGKLLSVGVVDGRNIWKNDFEQSLTILNKAKDRVGADRLIVGPSCSLIHSPVTLRNEAKLDDELKNWMAYAEEKIGEIRVLADAVAGEADAQALANNKAALDSRRSSTRIHNPEVEARCNAVTEADAQRKSPFSERCKTQQETFPLPAFPTTTIGSFPQTREVRAMRAKFKKGEITEQDYDQYIEQEIKKAIELQEEMGIDMLVHGEFERNDMVEYFGEQLNGFAFTQFGWVQSYGSRYVKPPVIYGDVSRPHPMTVRWSKYAQSLTDKPMKGMLTGPVTVLQWSFERNDQSRRKTALQIALALRDEVVDLEQAGIAAIQIDEPAFREGLPLRKADWDDYLKWAVNCFRVSSCGVSDSTQIHTHMCYAEFNDIIDSIADLDADVISVETSRSNMELLDAFVNFHYPNMIGPGVYDIHSPRVPDSSEMVNLLNKAREVLPADKIWVNPDCGLKTRQWEEVIPSLTHMVESARQLRAQA